MENEIDILKNFLESKEHYKNDLQKILYFGRKFILKKPGYLEVYPKEFHYSAGKELTVPHGIMTIVGGEIGSQGRYGVDFIWHNDRNYSYLHHVGIIDFIKMTLNGMITLCSNHDNQSK